MDKKDPLQAIFREIDGATTTARKVDVIRDHLHSAFCLIAEQRSPASVHLIAMAAHEMLTSIAHKRGKDLVYEIKGLRRQETKEDRDEAKFLYNFFKHARNDEEAQTSFPPRNLAILNEIVLASACVNFRLLFEVTDAAIERFLAYHALRFRNGLATEEEILIAEIEASKPISEQERLHLLKSGIMRAFNSGAPTTPYGQWSL